MTGENAPSPDAAEEAARDLDAAAAVLGENPEAAMWRAVVLARAGRTDEARQAVAELLRAHPQVGEFVSRLPAAGLIPTGAELVDPSSS